jgi:hypothetical protein
MKNIVPTAITAQAIGYTIFLRLAFKSNILAAQKIMVKNMDH